MIATIRCLYTNECIGWGLLHIFLVLFVYLFCVLGVVPSEVQ